jgi:Winged helix-turn-helix DNA-binding
MTPADEATFIALWQQGASQQELAARLGVPVGTIKSRASTLARQGKIKARPKGGAYPRQRHQAALAEVSSDTPGVSTQVSPDTPPMQYLPPGQGEMLPLLHDILQELRHLTGGLAARVSSDTPRVHRDTPRVSTGVSARTPMPAERGKSIRWNLHLSEGVREQIKARAKARGLQDSQMVEELLWLALSLVQEHP